MSLTPGQIVGRLVQSGVLNRTAAAGFAGNTMQESGDNPAEHGGNLVQWGGSRYTGLLNYASQHGLSPNSGEANLGYALQELRQPGYHALVQAANHAHSPQAAALLFSNIYERPLASAANNPARMRYAGEALAQYNHSSPRPNAGVQLPNAAGGAKGNTPGQQRIIQTVRPPTQQTINFHYPDFMNAGISAFLKAAPSGGDASHVHTGTGVLGDLNYNLSAMPQIGTSSTINHPGSTVSRVVRAATQGRNDAVANAAVRDVQGAPASAQKLISLLHQVSGAPYNGGNHDDINENAAQIRAQGTDCSGLISYLMGPKGLGIWHASLATPSINNAPGMQPGRGQYVTVWNNNQPGNSGHVFIRIGTRFFASEGGSGVGEISAAEARNYIVHGSDGGHYVPLHPKGL